MQSVFTKQLRGFFYDNESINVKCENCSYFNKSINQCENVLSIKDNIDYCFTPKTNSYYRLEHDFWKYAKLYDGTISFLYNRCPELGKIFNNWKMFKETNLLPHTYECHIAFHEFIIECLIIEMRSELYELRIHSNKQENIK